MRSLAPLAYLAHARPLLAGVGHRNGPLGGNTHAVRRDGIEPDRVPVVSEPVVERGPEVAVVDRDGARFDDRVDAGIDLLAGEVQSTEPAIGGEEVCVYPWYGSVARVLGVGNLVLGSSRQARTRCRQHCRGQIRRGRPSPRRGRAPCTWSPAPRFPPANRPGRARRRCCWRGCSHRADQAHGHYAQWTSPRRPDTVAMRPGVTVVGGPDGAAVPTPAAAGSR